MRARRSWGTLIGLLYAALAAAPAVLVVVLAVGALTGGASAQARHGSRGSEVASRGREMASRGSEVASRGSEVASRGRGIAGAAGELGFDEPLAYALIRKILSFGPRPAGSPAERAVADYLRPLLPNGHFEAVPGGLRNIVGSLPGKLPAIVLAAHYDTTPVKGYLGANNSAAGMAAVIEIARDLADDPRRAGQPAFRFVLFDGEEAPAGFSDFLAQGLRGSRAYVADHPGQTREMVLLDFIALYNEVLPRDLGSNATLWSRLVAAADSAGEGAYFPASTYEQVFDDDTPFNESGVPAVDLIDFNYPCWQKDCDDLSQVSQTSLLGVGRSVLALMRAERARFTTP